MALAAILTDADIQRLTREQKQLPPDWRNRLRPKRPKAGSPYGHRRAMLIVRGNTGGHFSLSVRVNGQHQADFSVILSYLPPKGTTWFRLRRHNGMHLPGRHQNRIEGNVVHGPHIHIATERYQQRGMDEDAFAIPTDRYTNIGDAIDCMIEDCNFTEPGTRAQGQLRLVKHG